MARKRRMKSNVFVKPDEQNNARFNSAMARKGAMKWNANPNHALKIGYTVNHEYRKNIQWAVMAATSPPKKCAKMALGVKSR